MNTSNIIGFLVVLFCTLMTPSISSRCIVDAGDDVGVCVDSHGNFSPQHLGVHISGGTPPYTILWEANHPTGLQNNPFFTASHFLEDTTVANPILINGIFEDSEVKFYVTVEDSSGVQCRDTVGVTFSSFLTFALEMKAIIQKGDTTSIFPNVDGIIPPVSITWSPDYNISDIHFAFPEVWPDTTTCYELTLVDGLGCVYDEPLCFLVIVDSTTNVVELENGIMPLRLFPNPTSGTVNLETPEGLFDLKVEVRNLKGNLVLKKVFSDADQQAKLELQHLSGGMYIVSLFAEGPGGTKIYQTKVIVE